MAQQASHASYQYQTSHTVPRPAAPAATSSGAPGNAYNPPRAVEVYTLPEAANNQIPADIRAQFHVDDQGRVIFFTAPPLETSSMEADGLSHSLRYLADKARRKEEMDKKRDARAAELARVRAESSKRLRQHEQSGKDTFVEDNMKALRMWSDYMDKGTDEVYRELHGEGWETVRDAGKLMEDLQNLTNY